MPSLPLRIVDAFTSVPFRGNPAAVCLLDGPRSEDWMRSVAAEMNLSETAFLSRMGQDYGLRWWTPTVEIELCGHATLASAHALWEQGETAPVLRFQTRSGLLTAVRHEHGIALDFPAKPATPCVAPVGLFSGLGSEPSPVFQSGLDYLVELPHERDVRALKPDFRLLSTLSVRGIIVTAPSQDPNYDFVSRFFAPASGIDEDPVTGSAHCTLAPFWAPRLGKGQMVGHQVSARGGVVRVELKGDRVALIGQAVTISVGQLLV